MTRIILLVILGFTIGVSGGLYIGAQLFIPKYQPPPPVARPIPNDDIYDTA